MQALRSALTPWRALLLAALLLAAQAAGLVHHVAHGPAAAGSAQATAFWGHAAPHQHRHLHEHPHEHGQPSSETVAECRLYDQLLGHGDALVGTASAEASPQPVVATPPRVQAFSGRGPAAAYQARAPPLA